MKEDLKILIDNHEVISFDIFDTLLLRPYARPMDLFIHIEEITQQVGFAQSRVQAELEARKKYFSDEEITLEQIYQEIDKSYINLKKLELALELQVLTKNPEMFEAYSYALEKQKQIIITSDMYLPKELLIKALKKNGYTNWTNFYYSAELNKTKHSSNLYVHILNDLKIAPQKILHIGDNYHSDYQMAISKGLSAFYYEKIITVFLNENLHAKVFHEQNKNDVGTSIILGLMAINNIKKTKNYWETLGYKYGGPAIFAYMKWLADITKEDNIEEILFVARDGYSLQKVFDLIKKHNVKTHYIYAPRFLNSLFTLDFSSQKFVGEDEATKAIKRVLGIYKDKHPMLKNTPDIKTSTEGEMFIEQHRDLYKRLAEEEQAKYLKYLEDQGIKSNNLAMIDSISISLSSQKLLSKVLPEKNLIGYYWLLAQKVFNCEKDYNYKAFQPERISLFADWGFMEFMMASPEPPISNLINGKPQFIEPTAIEQFRIGKYPDISTGIVNFTKDLIKIFGDFEINLSSTHIIRWINSFAQNPDKQDIVELKQMQHAADSTHENYLPLFADWYKNNELLETFLCNSTKHKDSFLCALKENIKTKFNIEIPDDLLDAFWFAGNDMKIFTIEKLIAISQLFKALLAAVKSSPEYNNDCKDFEALIVNRLNYLISNNNLDLMAPKNADKSKNILVVSHELSMTGAPRVLLSAIRMLKKNNYTVVVLSYRDGPMKEVLEKEGFHVHVKPECYNNKNLFIDIAKDFGLIIANTVLSYPVINFMENQQNIIWWLHESMTVEQLFIPVHPEIAPALEKAQNIYTVSNYSKDILSKYNKNIKFLKYGLEDTYTPEPMTKTDKKVTFSLLGSVDPGKAADVLIAAIRSLPDKYKQLSEFNIVGSIKHEWAQNVKNSSQDIANLHWHEFIPNVSESLLFKNTDVLTCISRDDSEPVVVTEAMMKTKPCLISKNVGQKDIVIDGVNGFVVETENVEALKNKIVHIIDNKEKLEEMGRNARQLYLDTYQMDRFEENLMEIITKTIEKTEAANQATPV